jgi:protein-S-isoprenylcysteine O-methyltransferase Ste14
VAFWGCWGLLLCVWIASGRHAAEQRGSAPGTRDTLSRLAGALAIAAVLSPAALWRGVTTNAPLPRALGVICLLTATAFAVWARRELGRMWASPALTRADHRLITSGPYALSRHPIYTGVIGMLAASALDQGFGRWLAIAAVVAVLLWGKMRQEERLLTSAFPREYADYRARVPALLPRPRRRRRQSVAGPDPIRRSAR